MSCRLAAGSSWKRPGPSPSLRASPSWDRRTAARRRSSICSTTRSSDIPRRRWRTSSRANPTARGGGLATRGPRGPGRPRASSPEPGEVGAGPGARRAGADLGLLRRAPPRPRRRRGRRDRGLRPEAPMGAGGDPLNGRPEDRSNARRHPPSTTSTSARGRAAPGAGRAGVGARGRPRLPRPRRQRSLGERDQPERRRSRPRPTEPPSESLEEYCEL